MFFKSYFYGKTWVAIRPYFPGHLPDFHLDTAASQISREIQTYLGMEDNGFLGKFLNKILKNVRGKY